MDKREISSLFKDECIRSSKLSMKMTESTNPSDIYENHNGVNILKNDYFWNYCFDEFRNGSDVRYNAMANLCKQHNILTVCDIGCAIAFQAKIFQKYEIKYIGIDHTQRCIDLSPHGDGITLFQAHYPLSFSVEDPETTCAVSDLCIGYEARSEDVFKQLHNDFKYFCGYTGMCHDLMLEYYDVLNCIICEGVPLYFMERKDV